MAKDNSWTITIAPPGGFAPSWFKNTWTSIGNKNQASDMTDVNLLDPNLITQGPGTADLTNGNESGAVTTLITSILRQPTSSNVCFGIGGAKLYTFSSTAVTNAGNWPHTISGSGTVTGCDVLHYQGKLLYSYNDSTLDSGSPGGNIGSYDLSSTFDDDYWTTALGGTILENAVHYMINGGDDVAYITNGRYIAKLDATTDDATALDFWQNSVVVSLSWNWNRVIAAVNRPNVSGSSFNQSAIYRWNGRSSSWEGDPVEVNGEIGALYTKNGTTFVWYKDATSTGGYWLARLNGNFIENLKRYKGSLPNQAEVGEHEGYLMWTSSNKVYMYGSADADFGVQMFQYMSGNQATTGAIASPFGDLLIASYSGTDYSLAKASGYTKSARWKSIVFKVSGVEYISQIDKIMVITEQMSSGAKVDFTLYYDQGKSNKALTQIAYSASNYTRHKILDGGPQVEDFRIDVSWANGSTSKPVKIRVIEISGHSIIRN